MSTFCHEYIHTLLFSLFAYGGSDSKASTCNAGDSSSIPGLGRSPGERNGNPLQYSCLQNSMDRLWGHKKSDTTEQLINMFIDICQVETDFASNEK